MLAVTQQTENQPVLLLKQGPDVAFEGVPLPDAEERETSMGPQLLRSLKLQLGPPPPTSPLVPQISKNWPVAHELW